MITTAPLPDSGNIVLGRPCHIAVTLPSPLADGATATLVLGEDVLSVPLVADDARTSLTVTLTVAQVAQVATVSHVPFQVTTGSGDSLVALVVGHLSRVTKWDGKKPLTVSITVGATEAALALSSANAAAVAQAAAEAAAAAAAGASDAGVAALVGSGPLTSAALSSTYGRLGSIVGPPAPITSAVPVVATTEAVSAIGYDPETGLYYGTSTANGHYQTSPDLSTWTDRTYSPSTYTPALIGWQFDETYMYAYASTGKVWRAVKGTFNAWTEITPSDIGALTIGRVGILCAVGSGVLLYGNYTSAAGDGAHIWRSTDAGATWTHVLDITTAKHVHAIRQSPTTGYVWASAGDAGYDGRGLYKSTDDGATWTLMSSNDYGIDMVFLAASGPWPDLVVLEGDGLNRPHVMAFPEAGAAGDDTFPLVWGWSGPTSDPLSWRGTARGIAVLPGNHLLWYTTTESGVVGTRAGVWVAQAPDYQRVILLRETTGAEPSYGRTFCTSTYVQNTQRRYATPTFGSY